MQSTPAPNATAMLPSPDEYEISPAALKALLDDDSAPDIRLVDCREEEEFAICRIDGAELIPLSVFGELGPKRLVSADDERPIGVYCHHGMRSMSATIFLRNKGRTDVWSLAGGIELWSKDIDPSVPRY